MTTERRQRVPRADWRSTEARIALVLIVLAASLMWLARCEAGDLRDAIYLDVQLIRSDSGIERYATETATSYLESRGVQETITTQQLSYDRDAANPYARVAIGMEVPLFGELMYLRAECFHESSIRTGRDRGVNGCGAGFRAYPFRVAR